jgi:alpha-methylacyl-CoA racemase
MGPLEGIRIVEFAGIGPAPFCAMVLADLGAQVIRIDRPSAAGTGKPSDVLHRGRPAIAVDLKRPAGLALTLRLIESADALIEGFRPGVMERLGLGPDVCQARNAKLVYGRMTGWGQTGPLRDAAGHDINYIALTGALHAIGRAGECPPPPLNLIGDFGGGGMLLAVGLLAGILEAKRSGKGQVIDAAMTDGAALLMAIIYGFSAAGGWTDQRASNLLDGGAPFYDTYECADGEWVAVGPIEPQFYTLFLAKAGIDDPRMLRQFDTASWPHMKSRLREIFLTKTRAEWCSLLEGSDACVAPVLDMREAPQHPHNVARGTFVNVAGVTQPAPAPRFSRTPASPPIPAEPVGARAEEALATWGLSTDEIRHYRSTDYIARPGAAT